MMGVQYIVGLLLFPLMFVLFDHLNNYSANRSSDSNILFVSYLWTYLMIFSIGVQCVSVYSFFVCVINIVALIGGAL